MEILIDNFKLSKLSNLGTEKWKYLKKKPSESKEKKVKIFELWGK